MFWGTGYLHQFGHWRKWLVNAASQNLPPGNAVLARNIWAEMYLFHQIFNGRIETFPSDMAHFDFPVSLNYSDKILYYGMCLIV